MPDDLNSLLDSYTSGALTAMASFHGLAKKGPKAKALTIAELSKALVERDRILRNWRDLSQAERATVEGILQRGGEALTRTLREALAQSGLIDKKQPDRLNLYYPQKPDPRAANSRRFEDILARLTLRGLVFAADDPSNPYPNSPAYEPPKRDFDRPASRVFIPEPIRRLLPAPPPLAPAAAVPVSVAAVQEGSARAFQRDLYLYWSFVRGQPLSLTAKDEPHKSLLKEVNATLLVRAELGKGEGEVDHPRLRFVRLLLDALGLSRIHADNRVAVTDQADFFALAPAERVRRCFEAWRDGRFFNELLMLPRRVRPMRVEPGFLAAGDEVIGARRTVLEYVEGLAADGDWIAFDALLSQIRELDYEFLFRRPPAPPYGYSSYYYVQHPYTASTNRLGLEFPDITSDDDGWDKVETGFIRGVIVGPLYWMGLADLGRAREAKGDEPPAAFRLTPLGEWLLGLGPQPDIPAEGGRVIVQPNLHVIALDPVNDATLVTLDHFAERLSAERAVEYRLTRESVYAGQQQGWDVARLKDFLRQHTGAELPGNVARTLDEWQAQHERIVLRPRVTLAHGTVNALDDLMRDPQTAPLVAARPAPELIRLKNTEAIPVVMKALGAQGILPLLTERPSVTPNSVEASESGEVRLLARRPSLYLHGHLAALADPAGEGRYQVSAATVARAARAGFSAPAAIERLQAVHRGPVPEALARRIRAWAKHYGEAALDEIILLQVRDAATLAELLADPDIAPLLQPFRPSSQKALARVRPEDAEKLRALLAERGVDLDDTLT